MGRNAPDSIYDFEVCYAQTYTSVNPVSLNSTGFIKSGYVSTPLAQGHDVIVSLPVGATGSAVTGCTIIGESSGFREDRKSTRLNSSHLKLSRMPSSA